MDIAMLLRAVAGAAAGAGQAPAGNAGGLAGSAAEAFGSLLAQELDAKSTDGQGQPGALPLPTGPPVEPNVQADPAEALPSGGVPVLLVPVPVPQPDATLAEALVGAYDQQSDGSQAEPDDQPTSGARVLDLALLTALVTWVDHAIGARGSQDVTTVEGRQAGSLSSDLPAALRQAIEETLAALDRQGTPIPEGIMANLEAIRDAVTVATPETIGGPLPDATVRAYADQLSDSLVKAVSQRFDYGAGLIEVVLAALGEQQRTALVQPTLPDRLRAEQLMNLLDARTESGTPQMRDAVQALLDALRGEVTRVQPVPDTVPASNGYSLQPLLSAPQPDTVRPNAPGSSDTSVSQAPAATQPVTGDPPVELLQVAVQPEALPSAVGVQAATMEVVVPRTESVPDIPAPVAGVPSTSAAAVEQEPPVLTAVEPVAPIPQRHVQRASVLATTPVEEIGSGPAFVTSSPRLTAAIEGTLVQAPAGRPGVTVPEQTGIVEAAEAYVRNGLGEARELLGARRWVTTPTNTVADDILGSARGGRGASTVGQVALEGADGRREVLSGEGLARLLAVLSGEERVDPKPAAVRSRTEGTSAAAPGPVAPGPVADAVAASVGQASTGVTDAPRGSPDVRDAMTERMSSTIMTQIDQGMHAIAQRGRHEVTIELKPPYLGDLQVTLRATEQAVTAHFQAQSHTVKALLESNMHLLRDMLQDAGLSADVLEVSVGFGGPGDGGAYRNPGEATRLYRILDPRHIAAPVELAARPVGERVGSIYGLASVVDLLA